MKNVILFVFVVVFLLVGSTTILADILPPLFEGKSGQLHFVNGVVGSGALLLAVAFAIPMKLEEAIHALTPFLDWLLRRDKASV
jgi:hypothetical protein